jgi:endonuclease/exonuclease/phosphatase family metal-dependent hydrolase
MRLDCFRARIVILVSLSFFAICSQGFAATLRIVSWNIEDDIDGATTPLPGFNTVLQGIGNELLAGDAQPLDIMGLEETTSNTTTVQPILNFLNADYPGSNYQTSSYQATEEGGDVADGNGPNAIVYNANTVTLLATVGVGTPLGSSNGEYRQVVRYEFEAVGSTSPFYMYVSHMKSGSTSADVTAQNEEAAIIRADELTLPAGSSVLYTGDMNNSDTTVGSPLNTLNAAGNGQGNDPEGFSVANQWLSESATDLRYRDDYQLQTSNVLNDTSSALDYVATTFNNFGNNGTTPLNGNVDSGGNTALAYMQGPLYSPTQSQILAALTTASDHSPVVADYTVVVPEPTCFALVAGAAGIVLARRNRRANAA